MLSTVLMCLIFLTGLLVPVTIGYSQQTHPVRQSADFRDIFQYENSEHYYVPNITIYVSTDCNPQWSYVPYAVKKVLSPKK